MSNARSFKLVRRLYWVVYKGKGVIRRQWLAFADDAAQNPVICGEWLTRTMPKLTPYTCAGVEIQLTKRKPGSGRVSIPIWLQCDGEQLWFSHAGTVSRFNDECFLDPAADMFTALEDVLRPALRYAGLWETLCDKPLKFHLLITPLKERE